MLIIGIDPDTQGGGVLLSELGAILEVMHGNEAQVILSFLARCAGHGAGPRFPVKAAIELQHAFPKIGSKANFAKGFGYGMWRGILTANSIGYESVAARTWQQIISKKKGWSREDVKRALVAEAIRRWPQIAEIPKTKQSGVSDAALLAEFTRTRGR